MQLSKYGFNVDKISHVHWCILYISMLCHVQPLQTVFLVLFG